ncbi:MAG: hypothetical protein P8129_15200 [Anaerolineae bacterium]
MKRRALVVFVLTAVVGLAGGLYYTWMIDPVEYYDVWPDSLRDRDKALYLALVGDLYAHEGDLARAEARLATLGVAADGPTLARFIEVYLDGGGRPEEVRNLAHLAEDLGASGGVLLVFAGEPTAGPPSPAPAATSLPGEGSSPATATPLASPTPAPTFELVEKTSLCGAPGRAGQIAVWTQDAQGQPLPGIEIVVSWAAGQDRFYTGLWPEQGAGYADFDMAPATVYEVYLADYRGDAAQELASDLSPGLCRAGVEAVDWRLTFRQSP